MISRRGFLKAVMVGTAGAMILPKLELLVPETDLLDLRGYVREIAAFDIYSDSYIIRYDALFDQRGMWGQFSVDVHLARPHIYSARDQAISSLRDRLIRQGVTTSDLLALPMPAGYVHPEWAMA